MLISSLEVLYSENLTCVLARGLELPSRSGVAYSWNHTCANFHTIFAAVSVLFITRVGSGVLIDAWTVVKFNSGTSLGSDRGEKTPVRRSTVPFVMEV